MSVCHPVLLLKNHGPHQCPVSFGIVFSQDEFLNSDETMEELATWEDKVLKPVIGDDAGIRRQLRPLLDLARRFQRRRGR